MYESKNDTPLLATKLYPPPARPGAVPRPRLTTRLNQGLAGKLTLICAPAGFGKTTLLGEWRVEFPTVQSPWAWVSLDTSDNQPNHFWAYVAASLEPVVPQLARTVQALLQASKAFSSQTIVAELINQIARQDKRILLCLDDYHFITDKDIHDSVGFFLDHLPSQLHLVIASRTTLGLPLSRLRGRGQLNELGAADLRFTSQEAVDFLNDRMGLQLSPAQVTRLEERTEGWIAGLQMAALSLQDRTDPEAFVAAFSGSHRHVADYLVDEVLEHSRPDVRDFLLQTGFLDQLNGSLCDVVTGRNNSQEILVQLEASNLFLIPLDDQRRWYRYHHLFGELLQARLQNTQPYQVQNLYLRAAAWCAQQERIASAVAYAMKAGAHEEAAKIVDEFLKSRGYTDASILLRDSGEWSELCTRLLTISQELLLESPYAYLFALHYAFELTQKHQEALDRLERLEERLNAGRYDAAMSPTKIQQLAGQILAIRMYVYLRSGVNHNLRDIAAQANTVVPEEDRVVRLAIASTVALSELVNGEVLTAEELLLASFSHDELRTYAPGTLSAIQYERGYLHESIRSCLDAPPVYREGSTFEVGDLGLLLAIIHYEKNQLDQAYHYATQSIIHTAVALPLGAQAIYHFTLAPILYARGEIEQATNSYESLLEISEDFGGPARHLYFIKPFSLHALYVRFMLQQGDQNIPAAWAKTVENTLAADLPFIRIIEHLTLARVYLAQGRSTDALNLLGRLGQRAAEQGRNRHLVEILALEAVAHQLGDDSAQALTILDRVLTLAEPEGYIRTFVDIGPPMARLLQTAAPNGIHPRYVSTLLRAFQNEIPASAQRSLQSPPLGKSPLIEPLSDREIEVLRLAADGLPNRAISQKLHITVGTVKSHLNTIYGKLHVNNRTQAGIRARELEIL